MQAPCEIGICGSYGGMNLGDEAILTVIIDELQRRLPLAMTVFSRHPEDTLTRHRVARVTPVHDLPRDELQDAVARLDLLIVGGGGILYDGEAALYLRPAEAALDRSVPVATWAIGAGPLQSAEDRDRVKRVLERAQLVTVRDRSSRLLLEECGIEREVRVTADPGFLLKPETFSDEMLAREGIDPKRPLVGISLREPGPAAPDLEIGHYRQMIADVVDFIIARTNATALFIPMERGDLREAYRVASEVDNADKIRFITGTYSAGEIRGLVGRLALAVGMRLHFLLFAAAAQVSLVGLSYGSKVAELLRELGAPMPPLSELSTGRLLAAVDRAWDERSEQPRGRAARLVELLGRADATADLVVGTLRDRVRQPELWSELRHA